MENLTKLKEAMTAIERHYDDMVSRNEDDDIYSKLLDVALDSCRDHETALLAMELTGCDVYLKN